MKRLRALLLPVLGLLTCLPAQATWSIVVIDRRTGEVGITSATCIADLDLSVHLPVVVVGHGAGAAQSAIDTQGRNRREIRQALLAGKTPDEILTWLAATDTSHQSRQYGLVSRTGPAVTFTGTGAGLARFGVTGSVGPYDYAIQGNVLTGDEVVLAAETAFRSTSGDMAERMMAGMEAAMGLGGDGRCSCAPSDPTGCGVPPVGFTHSAYTGFFIVARPGDSDGDCDAITGCVTGQYYGFLNFVGNANTADPVVELRAQFDAWRLGLQGRPDHFQSTWAWTDSGLVADGSDTAALELDLRDLLGQSTNPAGLVLQAEPLTAPALTAAPAITPLGAGRFEVRWTAGYQAGQESWRLVAELPGGERIPVGTPVTLRLWPLGSLVPGSDRLLSGAGSALPLALSVGASHAGSPYRILASTAGTTPGSTAFGVPVPLNSSDLLNYTTTWGGVAPFAGSTGVLDSQGHAEALWQMPPDRLLEFVGQTLSFAAVVQDPGGTFATDAVSILIEF